MIVYPTAFLIVTGLIAIWFLIVVVPVAARILMINIVILLITIVILI